MSTLKTLLVLLGIATIGAMGFVGLGIYNVAADDPHWPITHRLMETLRERSISTRADDIDMPTLDDEGLIRSGAGNYNSMCVGCHLSPGDADTELSLGLYPAPPTWSELGAVEPRQAFWVVKHGVKMSGMPAWGKSMEDRYIWGMVAFMQQFPTMTKANYTALINTSPGHSHGGGETKVVTQLGQPHVMADAAGRSSFEPVPDPMATDTDRAEHDDESSDPLHAH